MFAFCSLYAKSSFREVMDNVVPTPSSAMSKPAQIYNLSANTFNELCKRIQNNLFKVLVLGDAGVGKTSIIKQSALSCFTPNYKPTIGVDFVVKNVCYQHEILKMQLWDVAGQERLTAMTRVYYKDAVAAFIVYDQTRVETYNNLLNWKRDVDSKVLLPDGSYIPCIILANKCDEKIRPAAIEDAQDMNNFCKHHEFAGWFETSAKDNVGIEEAFEHLADLVVNSKDLFPVYSPSESDPDSVTLPSPVNNDCTKIRKKCLCLS